MSKLFIMAGTKGGIGKSLVAGFLADIAYDQKYRCVIFDCDDENRTLSHAYEENASDVIVHAIEMREHARRTFPLDAIVNLMVRIEQDKKHYPGENAFIIDMKAGTSAGTMDWLNNFPFLELKVAGIESNIVGVVTAEIDSCTTLLPWLRVFLKENMATMVRFSIIKNEIAGDDFEFFDRSVREVMILAKVPCFVGTLFDWGSTYQKVIQENNSSYGRIATGRNRIEKLGFMDEHRIRSYYADVSKVFAPLFNGKAPELSRSAPRNDGEK